MNRWSIYIDIEGFSEIYQSDRGRAIATLVLVALRMAAPRGPSQDTTGTRTKTKTSAKPPTAGGPPRSTLLGTAAGPNGRAKRALIENSGQKAGVQEGRQLGPDINRTAHAARSMAKPPG